MGRGRGSHDVLLVVGGAPILGAPVADAQQQRPPARAHCVRGGELGVGRGGAWGGGGSRLGEGGFWFGVAGFSFLGCGASRGGYIILHHRMITKFEIIPSKFRFSVRTITSNLTTYA